MIDRRRFIASAATTGLALRAVPAFAQAASYPSRTVKLIVPFAPGGAADTMGRMVAEHLQGKFGQPFVVENRPGAGSITGVDALAKSAPDGYTIGLGNIASHAIGAALQKDRLPYDPIAHFAPITVIGVTPCLLVVNAAKVPAKTVAEFIELLKSSPGKLNYGSSGIGTSLHLGMELFLLRSGTQMTHVPYRGSNPMVTDLVAGTIDAAMDAAATSMPHVTTGKLRALAVTTPERAFFAPELPPLRETVPGVELSPWHGLMAPAGTPAPIVALLADAVTSFLRSAPAEERLKQHGVVRVGNQPAEFAAFLAKEVATFRDVVEKTGIKPET